MNTENIFLLKSFKFALDTAPLCQMLNTMNEFVLSKQLLKAGTSVSAEFNEGLYSEEHQLLKILKRIIASTKNKRIPNS